MAELITRDGGAMSSVNMMRLIKHTLSDCVLDGCSVTKSGAVLNVSEGHIVAGGALVRIEPFSVTVSSSGNLVLRVDLDAEDQAQLMTKDSSTLTKQDLTTGGKVYELKMASYTFSSGEISKLSVNVKSTSSVTADSSASTQTSSASSNSTSSGGTATTKKSGTLASKVTATGRPVVNYSLSYVASVSGSITTLKLNYQGWLNTSGAWLGTGSKLTVYARVDGGAWKSTVIKPTSQSWKGTTRHDTSLSLSTKKTSGNLTVEWYVTRSGGSSGTAGVIGSSSNPKKHTISI